MRYLWNMVDWKDAIPTQNAELSAVVSGRVVLWKMYFYTSVWVSNFGDHDKNRAKHEFRLQHMTWSIWYGPYRLLTKKVQDRRDFNLPLLNTLNESIRERTSRRVIDQKHNVVLPFGDIIFYNEYQDKNKIHVRGHCLPNSKRQIQIFEDTFLKRLRRIYRNNNSRENNPYKCFMK